jgi:hypothetical protein
MLRWVLPFSLALGVMTALGSCATLDQAQCVTGDWASIGRRDGGEGQPLARLADHAKACAKHGVTPDHQAYAMGRDEGLQSYCTAPSGFMRGRSGSAYQGVCPGVLEQEFRAGYRDGQAVASVLSRLTEAESRRQTQQQRADEIRGRITDEERALSAAKTPEEARAIRDRIRSLRVEREQVMNEVDRAEEELRDVGRDIEDARARFTRIYGPF